MLHLSVELSFCQNSNDFEFQFAGRKFNEQYKDPPSIIGPFKGEKLANTLREYDVYISASIYDSCPMHVLEGLSCVLPILYILGEPETVSSLSLQSSSSH